MKHYALLPVPEETRDLCSILGGHLMQWPGVKMNHVFGTRAFYHRKVMFAMLPDRRSVESSTAISFIAPRDDEPRREADWHTFELTDCNIKGALVLLEKAYRDSTLHPFRDRSKSSTPVIPLGPGKTRDIKQSDLERLY
jgi:hypothetical protein